MKSPKMNYSTSDISRRGMILLATMNEFASIDAVLQEISESCDSLSKFGWEIEVLVIDDSLNEDFLKQCRVLGENYHLKLTAVAGPRSGLGAAILSGFERALSDPLIDFVINLDADGQHDARQIGDLLRAFLTTGAGITIGSRWTRGGRCYGLTYTRKAVSRVSSLALRGFGVPWAIKDPTTSFRVYNRRTIAVLVRDLVGFSGFSFFGAAIAHANANCIDVVEVPIIFRPRLSGDSKLRSVQILRAVRDLPSIRSTSKMVQRRNTEFLDADHGIQGPDKYNATRELEVLSATPISTAAIVRELDSYLGNSVLEIGAGIGQISSELQQANRKIVSIEPDENLFQVLSQISTTSEHTFHLGTLQDYLRINEPDNQKFDSVLYVNVLEHIQDDIAELRLASNVLSKNGRLIIFVPALPSLYGTMDSVSGHYRRYRHQELLSVIKSAGLEIERIYPFDPVGVFPYWLSYRILGRKKLGSGSVYLYDRIIIPSSVFVSKIFRWRILGKNLIAVTGLPKRQELLQ